MLENRDYTLIINRSGSMSSSNQPKTKSQWASVQESTLALARQCEELDSDGRTVYLFSHRFRRYRNVNSSQVERLFQDEDNTPQGGTNLSSVLQDATNLYVERKACGQSKPNGETIIVITDGVPNARMSVADVIVKASQRIERDEELAICFIQVGSDPTVTRFLKSLDNQLKGIGAKFDIVDTITMEDMKDMTLTEVLLNAIVD